MSKLQEARKFLDGYGKYRARIDEIPALVVMLAEFKSSLPSSGESVPAPQAQIQVGQTVKWLGQEGACRGIVKSVTFPENSACRCLHVDTGDGFLFPILEKNVQAVALADAAPPAESGGQPSAKEIADRISRLVIREMCEAFDADFTGSTKTLAAIIEQELLCPEAGKEGK